MYNWNSLTLASYHWQRKRVVAKFDKQGHGTRAKCAFALLIAASTVSNVLTGSYVSPRILVKLESWIDGQNNNS